MGQVTSPSVGVKPRALREKRCLVDLTENLDRLFAGFFILSGSLSYTCMTAVFWPGSEPEKTLNLVDLAVRLLLAPPPKSAREQCEPEQTFPSGLPIIDPSFPDRGRADTRRIRQERERLGILCN